LRDLHRGHEKDEKDKERAKAEVARLNGMAAGGGSSTTASSSSSGFGRGPTPSLAKPQVTPSQRKQHLAQLAEMGVAIPDEFRPDMAMAGEWQVTSERIVEPEGEKKPESMAIGVRKRALDEEETEAIEAKKIRWGSTYRSHQAEEDEGDLDTLLQNTMAKAKAPAVKIEMKVESKEVELLKVEPGVTDNEATGGLPSKLEQKPGIKREPSDEANAIPAVNPAPQIELQQVRDESRDGGIVFKKRKTKNIRQK
jgi:hypothetical protein